MTAVDKKPKKLAQAMQGQHPLNQTETIRTASVFNGLGYDLAGLGTLFISAASFAGVFIYSKMHQQQ